MYRGNWRGIRETYEAWWARGLERPVFQVYYPAAGNGAAVEFDQWSFLKYKDNLGHLRRLLEAFADSGCCAGDAFPGLFLNLGPGVLAACFSGYLDYDDFNQTAWFEKPQSWEEVEELAFEETNHWWQYLQSVTRMCADAAKDRFILGMTDIGGILDVLASLRGTENLLMDLLSVPDRVNRMRRRLLEGWHRAYDALAPIIAGVQQGTSSWLRIWCPGRYYPFQCDFCAMISPAMFESFVVPDVQEQCRRLGHGIYHLDGPGQVAHVDLLLEIPELDGIQWVPGSGNPQCDSPRYFPMYEKILGKGKLLVLQSFDDWRNIPGMLKALPNRGLLFSVNVANREEAREFLESVGM
ncbi:MAG TPA: hypothetical protein PLM14_16525 [Candidatus Hydrogenedentes bacterium]|nr:hypothetical protein [Candidatus Hydrogenedentota bacterium]HQH54080.1 hypothetical protein [Candidatus Hydrogenedentota bacterium]